MKELLPWDCPEREDELVVAHEVDRRELVVEEGEGGEAYRAPLGRGELP